MNYYVVRTHSHTDKQRLWKVMTRPLKCLEDAKGLKEHFEGVEKNPRHKYFITQTEFV